MICIILMQLSSLPGPFYGYPGPTAVAYDNERGKGDQRHGAGREEPNLGPIWRPIGPGKIPMDESLKVSVGGSLKDDLAAFRSAWERAERGETVTPDRMLAFESREGLAAILTGRFSADILF